MTTLLEKWQDMKSNTKASPKRIYESIRSEINRVVLLVAALRTDVTAIQGDISDIQAEQALEQTAPVIVAVNVSTGNGTGSSAADPLLIGGTIIGIVPTGNQDQLVDEVIVEADGKVKVTLAANATAQNTFNVSVLKTVTPPA